MKASRRISSPPFRRLLRDLDGFNDPRRIARHDTKVRHILRYNAPRADSDAFPDRHTGKDDTVSAEPTVFTDGDGAAVLRAARAVAEDRVRGVGAAEEGAVGPDERAVADGDRAGVYPGAVGVDVYVLAESWCVRREEVSLAKAGDRVQ